MSLFLCKEVRVAGLQNDKTIERSVFIYITLKLKRDESYFGTVGLIFFQECRSLIAFFKVGLSLIVRWT